MRPNGVLASARRAGARCYGNGVTSACTAVSKLALYCSSQCLPPPRLPPPGDIALVHISARVGAAMQGVCACVATRRGGGSLTCPSPARCSTCAQPASTGNYCARLFKWFPDGRVWLRRAIRRRGQRDWRGESCHRDAALRLSSSRDDGSSLPFGLSLRAASTRLLILFSLPADHEVLEYYNKAAVSGRGWAGRGWACTGRIFFSRVLCLFAPRSVSRRTMMVPTSYFDPRALLSLRFHCAVHS